MRVCMRACVFVVCARTRTATCNAHLIVACACPQQFDFFVKLFHPFNFSLDRVRFPCCRPFFAPCVCVCV